MKNDTVQYEIISAGDKVLGKVWWDEEASKIDTDNPQLLDFLKDERYNGITFRDGEKFLQSLGKIFTNGYVSVKKVKK
jgi:hypothetical protein